MSNDNVTPLRPGIEAPASQPEGNGVSDLLRAAAEEAKELGANRVFVVMWIEDANQYVLKVIGNSSWREAVPALECAKRHAVDALMGRA